MSEKFTISGPIEIKDNSKEKVAFDLAMNIANKENLYDNQAKYRQKILDLYAECLKATSGYRKIKDT